MRLPCISSSAHAAIRKHCSLAPTAPGICSAPPQATHCWGATVGPRGGRGRRQVPPPSAPCESVDEFTIVRAGLDNDPSAGSPTETLLRLLLPLNDKVQWTSRDVAGGEPPPSPRS